ncbi:MAG TPA: DUF4388 domain-containing protein [Thermoanaerobaculia bacterium]|nr:DUF4388 domain-containing protein [Thermoanaerobaculia bacterium]
MAFQGSLADLPLPDIIQLVSVSGKTGVFDLTRGSRRGQIFLRDGQIVHAEASRLRGEEAFYELATWTDGEFTFTAGADTSSSSIEKSNTNLLMEAARRMDEWRVLSKRIPSTAHIPVFVDSGVGTAVSFTPQEWAIVCRLDGRRSIEEIALSLGQSPFETCKHIYGLLTSGLIDLIDDLFDPLPERLRELDADDAEGLLRALESLTRDQLGAGDEETLDNALQVGRRLVLSGRPLEGVMDATRSSLQAVSSSRGVEAGHAFAHQLRQLLAGAPS